ncbi:hypothetical protein Ancab_003317 [Ancistrocladus abbreviatus]
MGSPARSAAQLVATAAAMFMLLFLTAAAPAAATTDDALDPAKLGQCLALCGTGIVLCAGGCINDNPVSMLACIGECGKTNLVCMGGCAGVQIHLPPAYRP